VQKAKLEKLNALTYKQMTALLEASGLSLSAQQRKFSKKASIAQIDNMEGKLFWEQQFGLSADLTMSSWPYDFL
jgi:hypothetical protein